MYIVTNRIEVPAETATAFEETFAASMKNTLAGVPGLHRATLLRPEAPGLPYVSTMEFASKDDFLAWMRSDSFRASHSDPKAAGMQSRSKVEQHTLLLSVEN